MDLSNQNRQQGGRLTGGIPHKAFKKLRDLSVLNLAGNGLRREIPAELGRLDRLQTLNLSSNAFERSIPPELGRLEHLDTLDLSNNQLTGSIPTTIAHLKRTSVVRLNGNQNLQAKGRTASFTLPLYTHFLPALLTPEERNLHR